jgi:hypothetical protein
MHAFDEFNNQEDVYVAYKSGDHPGDGGSSCHVQVKLMVKWIQLLESSLEDSDWKVVV